MSENAKENEPSEPRKGFETPRVSGPEETPDATPVPLDGDGSGEVGSKVCKSCGKRNPASADVCRQCKRYLRGNRVNGTDKVARYKANGNLPPDLRVSLDEFRMAVISDQGGTSELSAIRAGLCRLLVDAEAGRRLLMNEIVAKGVGSKPGRAAYDRLLATMTAWTRIAGHLGLDRRAKAALTPQEYWRRRQTLGDDV